ncbi:adenylyl-sulfate kinase 3-like isoform X2 [Macadamia integrifolia]|uniref:adenylyl-sulfate kinase 3-like isoform X2 n=1 Tax=Macadamia integrifolia TaxID=60698 RepID=UPI001C4E7370|nr:adenylyl-sulfate kinase 3-like isoform X2 [Macadamia integrifolia]
MTPAGVARPLGGCNPSGLKYGATSHSQSMLGVVNFPHYNDVRFDRRFKSWSLSLSSVFSGPKSKFSPSVKAVSDSNMAYVNGKVGTEIPAGWPDSQEPSENDHPRAGLVSGKRHHVISTVGNSTNIMWHECSIGKIERQKLLQQKGCVIWITGLSGSGKSTVACALSRGLYNRGKLSYLLDGDNIRHGLNQDLSFAAEDRAENIRRIGEVAKLFAEAGIICIASLISPYQRDRDACRALMTDGNFVEVFLDVPLQVCEARDPKGLYKLAREGKIKDFTGIDDPYEPPLNCEIVLRHGGAGASPCEMAEKVISYLEEKGFLHA